MTDGPHLIGNGSSPPVQPIRGSSKPSNALDPSQPLKPTLPGHSAYHPERLFLPTRLTVRGGAQTFDRVPAHHPPRVDRT